MKKLLYSFVILIVLSSCSGKGENKILIDSAGRLNNVVVVINNEDWQGEVGNAMREVLAKEVLGLPQPEPLFNLSQIVPASFSHLLTAQRNILVVKYGEENNVVITKNVYAEPQQIITVQAKNKVELLKLVREKHEYISNSIRNSDLSFYQKRNLKRPWNPDKIELFNELNISMKIPRNYGQAVNSKEYLWCVKDIPDGYQNILVYSLPINSLDDENGKNIIKTRDLYGHYIPGPRDSKMITEAKYAPHIFETELRGLKTFETIGKWEMDNDVMAGPFINYTVVDKKNNRLIVVEGSVYAPNKNKRNYMFEIEGILKSLIIE